MHVECKPLHVPTPPIRKLSALARGTAGRYPGHDRYGLTVIVNVVVVFWMLM